MAQSRIDSNYFIGTDSAINHISLFLSFYFGKNTLISSTLWFEVAVNRVVDWLLPNFQLLFAFLRVTSWSWLCEEMCGQMSRESVFCWHRFISIKKFRKPAIMPINHGNTKKYISVWILSAVKPKLNFATLENDASENHDRSSKSHAHKLISIRIAANSSIFISLFLSGVDIDPCGQTIAHTLYFFPIINITLKK